MVVIATLALCLPWPALNWKLPYRSWKLILPILIASTKAAFPTAKSETCLQWLHCCSIIKLDVLQIVSQKDNWRYIDTSRWPWMKFPKPPKLLFYIGCVYSQESPESGKISHLQFQQTEVHNLRWNKEMSIRFQHCGLKERLCISIATFEDWKKRLEFTYWKWSLAVLNANLCKKLTCIYVIYIHLYIAYIIQAYTSIHTSHCQRATSSTQKKERMIPDQLKKRGLPTNPNETLSPQRPALFCDHANGSKLPSHGKTTTAAHHWIWRGNDHGWISKVSHVTS